MRSKNLLLAMAVGGTLGLGMTAANAQDAGATGGGAAAAPAAPAGDSGQAGGAAPAPAPAADAGASGGGSAAAPAADAGAAPAPAADAGAAGGSAPAPAADAGAAPAPAADAGLAGGGSETTSSGGSPEGGFFQNLFGGIHLGGYIRPEFAISTTNVRNENNTRGDPYNNQLWFRPAYNPDTTFAASGPLNVLATAVPVIGAPISAIIGTAVSLPNGGSGGASWSTPLGVGNYGVRSAPNSTNLFHMHYLRFEIEMNWKLSNDFAFTGRLRTITDPGHYSSGSTSASYFNGSADGSTTPRAVGGDPALYGGGANLFAFHSERRHYIPSPAGFAATRGKPLLAYYSIDNHPLPLEWSSNHYLIYFPTFFIDWQHGPLSIRLGNQQIAWGQALFFRVLDTPNGLDTRRHLILDQAAEEFGDKRTPSPSIRVGYQFTDDILADGFVKMFTPTILPNPETPYNLIPDQFTIHDLYEEKKWRLDYGIRLKGNFGNFGAQFIAIRHMDPGGAFRWSQSAVVKGLPLAGQSIPGVQPTGGVETGAFSFTESTLALGQGASATGNGPLPCAQGTAAQCAFGQVFSQTPFEAAASGVYSSNEWFHYAGDVRLNGVTGLNGAIVPFPAAGAALAGPVTGVTPPGGVPYSFAYSDTNRLDPLAATRARNELDTFFGASGGGLRGHLVHEYFRETIIGGGLSYVTQGKPGSVLDQLIINVETSYTPKHTFTDPSLYRTLADPYLRQANWISDVVMEKYQRFSQSFPATYFVFQYEHRMKDDIFGRSLRGYAGSGGKNNSVARRDPTLALDTTTISNNVVNQGASGGSNYVVFAFLQPFPQAIYRADFAMLCDVRGGCLVQPGVRWKPRGDLTIEGFYTYINGRMGGNDNNNAISTLQFAQEFTVRLGYQF